MHFIGIVRRIYSILLWPSMLFNLVLLIQVLDKDGLAAPGEILRNGDIYINKESPVETRGPLKNASALEKV